MVARAKISIPKDSIAGFCRRWRISEIGLFGSVLRDDFGPASDVDVLVSFEPGATWGYFDFCRMEEELAAIFGRCVDVVTRRSVEQSENYIRRKEILEGVELLDAAG